MNPNITTSHRSIARRRNRTVRQVEGPRVLSSLSSLALFALPMLHFLLLVIFSAEMTAASNDTAPFVTNTSTHSASSTQSLLSHTTTPTFHSWTPSFHSPTTTFTHPTRSHSGSGATLSSSVQTLTRSGQSKTQSAATQSVSPSSSRGTVTPTQLTPTFSGATPTFTGATLSRNTPTASKNSATFSRSQRTLTQSEGTNSRTLSAASSSLTISASITPPPTPSASFTPMVVNPNRACPAVYLRTLPYDPLTVSMLRGTTFNEITPTAAHFSPSKAELPTPEEVAMSLTRGLYLYLELSPAEVTYEWSSESVTNVSVRSVRSPHHTIEPEGFSSLVAPAISNAAWRLASNGTNGLNTLQKLSQVFAQFEQTPLPPSVDPSSFASQRKVFNTSRASIDAMILSAKSNRLLFMGPLPPFPNFHIDLNEEVEGWISKNAIQGSCGQGGEEAKDTHFTSVNSITIETDEDQAVNEATASFMVTAGIMASAASVLMGGPSALTVLGDVQSLVMISSTSCNLPVSHHRAASSMVFLSPFFGLDGFVAVSLGNFFMTILLVAVHVIVVVYVFYRGVHQYKMHLRKAMTGVDGAYAAGGEGVHEEDPFAMLQRDDEREKAQRKEQQRQDLLEQKMAKTLGRGRPWTIEQAMAYCRFPSWTTIPVVLLLPGLAFSSFYLMFHTDVSDHGDSRTSAATAGGEVTLGALCALWVLAVPPFLFFLTKRCVVDIRIQSFSDSVNPFTSRVGQILGFLVIPMGYWRPKFTRRRYGRLFVNMAFNRKHWAGYPLPVVLAVAILATSFRPTTTALCMAQYLVIACVFLIAGTVVIFVTPHRIPVVNILVPATYFELAAITATKAYLSDHPVSDGAKGAEVALTIILLLTLVCRLLVEAFGAAMEHYQWRRDPALRQMEEQETEHGIAGLRDDDDDGNAVGFQSLKTVICGKLKQLFTATPSSDTDDKDGANHQKELSRQRRKEEMLAKQRSAAADDIFEEVLQSKLQQWDEFRRKKLMEEEEEDLWEMEEREQREKMEQQQRHFGLHDPFGLDAPLLTQQEEEFQSMKRMRDNKNTGGSSRGLQGGATNNTSRIAFNLDQTASTVPHLTSPSLGPEPTPATTVVGIGASPTNQAPTASGQQQLLHRPLELTTPALHQHRRLQERELQNDLQRTTSFPSLHHDHQQNEQLSPKAPHLVHQQRQMFPPGSAAPAVNNSSISSPHTLDYLASQEKWYHETHSPPRVGGAGDNDDAIGQSPLLVASPPAQDIGGISNEQSSNANILATEALRDPFSNLITSSPSPRPRQQPPSGANDDPFGIVVTEHSNPMSMPVPPTERDPFLRLEPESAASRPPKAVNGGEEDGALDGLL